VFEQMIIKPFEQETTLQQMKADVFRLEREIALKIQENQVKQQEAPESKVSETPETLVNNINQQRIITPVVDIKEALTLSSESALNAHSPPLEPTINKRSHGFKL